MTFCPEPSRSVVTLVQQGFFWAITRQVQRPCESFTLLDLRLVLHLFRYSYDVDQHTQAFTNRRVFAFVDAGVPDGLQVDKAGNVYAGCADGVHVRIFFLDYFPVKQLIGMGSRWNVVGKILFRQSLS